MRLVKPLRVLALWLVIPLGAIVQLQMVGMMRHNYKAVGAMRDQLQRSGLAQVTSLRGIPQFCEDVGFLDGFFYSYAVDVARIPDTYWATAAARRHWQRGPFDLDRQFKLEQWAEPESPLIKGCPKFPVATSSRFVVTFFYEESGKLGPQTEFTKGAGVMVYDTRTSRLYWKYSGS
ncbi:hypothetical protein [Xanthomonas sacchari]|uniref:Uncharacterized protein n=1 Tax=Xanthomonas sacchari TaxID=56458 RepID=A0A2P5YZ38_9XANT|nr:hypothetical protein [Xanthomonas sacchari]MDV0440446.1 hypothetical protein [Xanthomonas sacchari]PPU80119.1 hypothetical protein XsacCFBP4641_19275 [Xanthomonas sacchari]